MNTVHRRLHETVHRLRSVRLVRSVVLFLAVALGAVAAGALVDKTGILPWSDWRGTGIRYQDAWRLPGVRVPKSWQAVLGAAVALALCAAWIRARLLRLTPEQAALALEHRTGTKERLTSATDLADSGLPLAPAVAEDAERIAAEVDVKQAFPLRAGSAARALGITAGLLAGILVVLPELDLRGLRTRQREAEAAEAAERAEVETMGLRLREEARRLRKMRHRPRPEHDSRELAELAERMERAAQKMEQDDSVDAKAARTMMNRLQEDLKEGAEARAQMTNRLADLAVPRDRGALLRDTIRNLKEGDMKGAGEALRRLQENLAGMDRLDPESMRALASEAKKLAAALKGEGMEELGESFAQMARALETLNRTGGREALERIAQENPELAAAMRDLMAGRTPPPGGIDLSQLSEEDRMLLGEIMQAMAEMRQGMEQACSACQAGAQRAQTRELTTEDLLALLEAIEKGELNPAGGGGMGGHSIGLGGVGGLGMGDGTGGQGQGMGGQPPEQAGDTAFTETRLQARQLSHGQIVGQWFVRGQPPKDETTRAAYLEAVEAVGGAADVVRERESVPAEDRNLVRDYQNAIRGVE